MQLTWNPQPPPEEESFKAMKWVVVSLSQPQPRHPVLPFKQNKGKPLSIYPYSVKLGSKPCTLTNISILYDLSIVGQRPMLELPLGPVLHSMVTQILWLISNCSVNSLNRWVGFVSCVSLLCCHQYRHDVLDEPSDDECKLTEARDPS